MKKRLIMMVASINLLIFPLNVFANGEVYPLKSQYQDGVEVVDISLFSNEKIEKPIETGFENSSEIDLLINETQSNQLYVSEDSYSGKFSLKIEKSNNEIIPVYETQYFKTGHESLNEGLQENVQVTISEGTYNTKCNFYTLMLKPMSDSETLSFYVKVKKVDQVGNVEEDYALIKSDSDRDGIFSVGTDLSRGKWQTVQLNIGDLDEEYKNGVAAGLYMNANKGSQWLIDDISSDYRKINEAKFELSKFATENVIYKKDGLRFANNKDSADYSIGSKVVSGGIKVSDKISDIKINSRLQYASGENDQQVGINEVLLSIPFENDICVVNNEGDDVLCEKVNRKILRDELPTVTSYATMDIQFKPETEKSFRLLLINKSEVGRSITIETESGTSKDYYLSNFIYTDWYDSNITISGGTSLSKFLVIRDIEYETIEDNPQQDILIGQGGSFSVNLGEFVSDDRVNLKYGLWYENPSSYTSEILLELFEGDSETPYYATKTYTSALDGKQTFNNIIPKIRANTKLKITGSSINAATDKIRVSDLEILKVSESDWNNTMDYVDYEMTEKKFSNIENSTYIKQRLAKDIYSEEEKYAVLYPDTKGVVNTGTINVAAGGVTSDISIFRILNLSKEPVKALISTSSGSNSSYGTPIYLHYGLADYVVSKQGQYLALPPDENVMLISKTSYSNTKSDESPIHYTFVDGLYDGDFITSEDSIIYSNIYDNGSAYKYDLESKINQKLTSDQYVCSSPDGTHILVKDSSAKHYILNITTNEKEEIPLSGSYKKCFFNIKNELFVVNTSLSYYSAGEFHALASGISSSTYISYNFDSKGEYLLWSQDKYLYLYKNTNGIWNQTMSLYKNFTIKESVLSNDISTAYISSGTKIYTVNLNTQTVSELLDGDIFGITNDNMLLFGQYDYYYLYNPVTAEKYKLFNSSFVCNSIVYNTENNMVMGIMPNSRVIYQRFTSEEPETKYALSFDGCDNWYVYAGGRWQNISERTVPISEELRLEGMTASEVNNIPSLAYEKLYSSNTDVLTVDIAIYMYSNSKKCTPVVENIIIETIESENIDGLYGINIEKYNKNDYRKITSLFPVENFVNNAECYYLFYIGNDWLYTYKDNEIVLVNESADTLLSDMSESWIKFKQYGMTAKELRRVPGEVLTQLFVNDDFANTEFGVIYVIKTKNEDTSEYVVNFRLGSSSDFITDDDIVVELITNSGAVKIIDSTEFSVTDIENLLSWIEARQNGNGNIFYHLSNENTQHFINYYMINSISVYNGEEYRAKLMNNDDEDIQP